MPDPKATPEAEAALRAVEAGWNAAALHWDPASLAALYTEDALLYGGLTGHSVGQEQVRGYFESYLGMFTTVRLALVEQELRAIGPDIVLAQGYASFEFEFTAGVISQSVLRSTWLLTRRAEGWRILQHHFSAIPVIPLVSAPT